MWSIVSLLPDAGEMTGLQSVTGHCPLSHPILITRLHLPGWLTANIYHIKHTHMIVHSIYTVAIINKLP